MMKYVVTGGAGFIGSNLVDKLIASGEEVHVLDNFSTGKEENCNSQAKYHKIDISDKSKFDEMKEVCEKVDTVFHCAALARVQPSIENPINYEINNTIGTVNILKACVDSGVRRFVFSGSSSVYGPSEILPSKETHDTYPISPYANQKLYGELCCKMFSQVYGLETISLRYFNVYGERQNLGGAYATVVGIFINQFINNIPLTINGDGTQRRDFTYVGDVVNANILASKTTNKSYGEVINIGSGKNISINNLADMISKKRIHLDPVKEPKENLADISKAQSFISWEPKINIEDWVKLYLKS